MEEEKEEEEEERCCMFVLSIIYLGMCKYISECPHSFLRVSAMYSTLQQPMIVVSG